MGLCSEVTSTQLSEVTAVCMSVVACWWDIHLPLAEQRCCRDTCAPPPDCQLLKSVSLNQLELTKESHAVESEKQGGASKRKNSFQEQISHSTDTIPECIVGETGARTVIG